MLPDLKTLHDEIVERVHAASPAGASVFPLPGIDTVSLVETAVKIALSQTVANFGGTVEGVIVSQRDKIKTVVADNVLEFAAKIIADLQAQ